MAVQTDPNQVLKIWFIRAVKFGLFIFLILGFYIMYLDAWVQNRMDGPKWETPVKIFARPLQLYSLKYLPQRELVDELELMGYSTSSRVRLPGQYKQSERLVEIYRREFIDKDGVQLAQKFRVRFDGRRISEVQHLKNGDWQKSELISLDPLLISRQQQKSNEDRDILDLSLVPEWMIDTLLVVEDRNFYHHYGVSPFAIVRALFVNIQAGRKVQGGSTLTQQLAKNLLLNDNRKTYLRKFNEILIALILDYQYSKDEILEAYFNEVYLGQNGSRAIHGFALASQFYFGKPLQELKRHEFALLVGIVKGPSYYHPVRQEKRAKARRDLVLQLMVSEGVIDRDEYQYYVAAPMKVRARKTKRNDKFPAYMQLVRRELEQLDLRGESDNGLLVFTGLDPLLQKRYQTKFTKNIKQLETSYKQKDINGALVSVELEDGSISAIVGDKNAGYAGFNRALDSNRNIGSLIKPAVYLTALNSGYHLASKLKDQTIEVTDSEGKTWVPRNYDKKLRGDVLLIDALTNSLNIPTVHLGMDLGVEQVAKTLRRLGVERTIPRYPSMLLGAMPMSPLEVAKWYQPIANYGQKHEVTAVQSVTDAEGILLWKKSSRAKAVESYSNSYELGYALQKVTLTGTSKRLGKFFPKTRYAGKTGTTDDARDSWFVGFDQNRVTSIWVGKDDNKPVNLTGSQGALDVFINLQDARSAESIQKPMPHDVATRYVEKGSGAVLDDECGDYGELPIANNKVENVKKCPSLFDWL